MSKLKPWTEDGAPEAISYLIDAARREQPSNDSLSRTLAAVGASIITASAAGAAGAPLARAGASGIVATKPALLGAGLSAVKWMLLGAGLGSAVVVAVAQNRGPERSSQSTTTLRANTTPAPSRARSDVIRSSTELPVAVPEPTRAVPRAVPALPSSRSAATSPAAPKADARASSAELAAALPTVIDSERLAEEVRSIDNASTALKTGRSAQTLTLLDEYDRRYPERRFAPEALYLRMEALLQAGRLAQARVIAEQFLAVYPNSPQSARARLLLKQTNP